LLNSATISSNNDTRNEENNPTTNFRTSDLGLSNALGNGITSVIGFGAHSAVLRRFCSDDQLEDVVLTLTCKSPGSVPAFGIKAGAYTSTLDVRFTTWASPDGSASWTSGGSSSVDASTDDNPNITHTAEGKIEIKVYNSARAALKGFTSFNLVLYSTEANAATYYSAEAADSTKRPVLTLYFRDGTSTERLGSASLPTIPSL